MYHTKNGFAVCENVDDLVNIGITGIWEDKDFYYVSYKKSDPYDGGMYTIDKMTEEVSFSLYLQLMFRGNLKNATPVDVQKFLSERRKRSA